MKLHKSDEHSWLVTGLRWRLHPLLAGRGKSTRVGSTNESYLRILLSWHLIISNCNLGDSINISSARNSTKSTKNIFQRTSQIMFLSWKRGTTRLSCIEASNPALWPSQSDDIRQRWRKKDMYEAVNPPWLPQFMLLPVLLGEALRFSQAWGCWNRVEGAVLYQSMMFSSWACICRALFWRKC